MSTFSGAVVRPDEKTLLVKSGGKIEVEAGGELDLNDLAGLLFELPMEALDGSSGKKACLTRGLSLIAAGTGIADMTIGAPSPGDIAIIRIASRTSGDVVVTGTGTVKLSGSNTKATFDAVDEALVLVYKAANTWEVVLNVGGVVLGT